jgi:hypothetical protein
MAVAALPARSPRTSDRPTPPPGAGRVRSAAAPHSPARQTRKAKLPPLYHYLARVPDARDPRGRRHPLAAILALVCLAMLSGIQGYLPAAQ